MPKRLLTRSLHAITLSAVAGAAVLAPTAGVAADASTADDVDNAESSATLTPESQDSPDQTNADDATGTDDPAQTPDETGDTPDEVEDPVVEDVEPPAEVETKTAEKDAAVNPLAAPGDEGAEDEVILPDTGLGKYSQPVRVGVDLAEGTYVPDGVTTAGSVLRITETGPDVPEEGIVTECTTEASTAVGTATYCVFEPEPEPEVERIGIDSLGSIAPRSLVIPENPNAEQDPQVYLAERTSTVTVTQLSAPAGLVDDPEPAVVAPCGEAETVPREFEIPGIGTIVLPGPSFDCTRKVALMEDTGLPPLATDDAATTEQETPVDIDVLANDDSVAGAPITSLDVTEAPENGTVRVVGSNEDAIVEYTPADGFVGTDTFGYGYTTPNGAAFATVTVEVEAAEEVAPARVVSSALPDAGGPDRSLFGWAAALIVAGAGALTLGRRRVLRSS